MGEILSLQETVTNRPIDIVDVGCATGEAIAGLATAFTHPIHIDLLDINEEGLEKAAARTELQGIATTVLGSAWRLQEVLAKAYEIDIPNTRNSKDLLIISHSLTHAITVATKYEGLPIEKAITYIHSFLEQALAITRVGGKLLFRQSEMFSLFVCTSQNGIKRWLLFNTSVVDEVEGLFIWNTEADSVTVTEI